MKSRTRIATIILSATLLSGAVPASFAYAHGNWDQAGDSQTCERAPLSQDKIDLLRATFKNAREDNKAAFEEMHKLHKERHDILVARTFDKEAFLAVSTKIEQKHVQIAKHRDEAFASIADRFTPEERERLSHMWHHHRHHHGHHHGEWGHDTMHDGWHNQDGRKDDMSTHAPMSSGTPQEEPTSTQVQ